MRADGRIRHGARRALRRAYEVLGDHEAALPLTLALTPESVRSRWVGKDTDLVVEGFPRSGNTYAALSIALAQPDPFSLRSHAHSPAQVHRAVRLGVPTLLVVRSPEDAVCSMAVADAHHRTRDLLRYWIHYHEQVAPALDGLRVAPFEQVTTDMAAVVADLNDRFGRALVAPADGGGEAVFAAIEEKQRRVHGGRGYTEAVPRPDPGRADALARRRAELEAEARPGDRERARRLHSALVGA